MRILLVLLCFLKIAFPTFATPPDCKKIPILKEELVVCTLGSGPVTFLLEAGGGNGINSWGDFPKRLAAFGKVIVYDRVGIGQSTFRQPKHPITAAFVSQYLAILLQQLKIKPPLVLIAHSRGGLYAQYFARMYPSKVQGLILLDSASAFEPRDGTFSSRQSPQKDSIDWWETEGDIPSFNQLESALPFKTIPVTVFAADSQFGPTPSLDEKQLTHQWLQLQEKLAQSSPRGKFILAKGSSHDIFRDQPHLVLQAVKEMIQQICH